MKRKMLALGLLLWWFCPLRWILWAWRELSTCFDNWADLARFTGFLFCAGFVIEFVAFWVVPIVGTFEMWLDMLVGHFTMTCLIVTALAVRIVVRDAHARADEILTTREKRAAQAGDMTMVEDD